MGNHFPCEEYPQECAIFDGCVDDETKDASAEVLKARNGYDNTMVCVDKVLFSVIEIAKEFLKERPAFVLFVSDHGETPRRPWRNAASRDLWELPMVLWMNEEYKRCFPELVSAANNAVDRPMTSDRLFWGMCSLMQVTCQAFPDQEDIFSGNYRSPKQRRVYRGKYLYERDGKGEFLAE